MADELQLSPHELEILSKFADDELSALLKIGEVVGTTDLVVEDMRSDIQIDDRMFDLHIFDDDFCTEGHVACVVYECDPCKDEHGMDNWTTNKDKCYHLWERKIELMPEKKSKNKYTDDQISEAVTIVVDNWDIKTLVEFAYDEMYYYYREVADLDTLDDLMKMSSYYKGE